MVFHVKHPREARLPSPGDTEGVPEPVSRETEPLSSSPPPPSVPRGATAGPLESGSVDPPGTHPVSVRPAPARKDALAPVFPWPLRRG